MLRLEVFRARAFHLALAFCLAVSAATAAAFGLIYLEVSRADVQRVAAILVDEAAKSEGDSDAQLRRALELRLTRDIRRLDYVALFDAKDEKLFGNVSASRRYRPTEAPTSSAINFCRIRAAANRPCSSPAGAPTATWF